MFQTPSPTPSSLLIHVLVLGCPQDVFRIITNQRGGDPSPKTPSTAPQTKVTIVGRNEIYNREVLVWGQFLRPSGGQLVPPPPPGTYGNAAVASRGAWAERRATTSASSSRGHFLYTRICPPPPPPTEKTPCR